MNLMPASYFRTLNGDSSQHRADLEITAVRSLQGAIPIFAVSLPSFQSQ
jgi:hypothetical protein